jgi:hypothetical protein
MQNAEASASGRSGVWPRESFVSYGSFLVDFVDAPIVDSTGTDIPKAKKRSYNI